MPTRPALPRSGGAGGQTASVEARKFGRIEGLPSNGEERVQDERCRRPV
ncbi:MAG TPA: hypothetical protein VK388_17285 [Pyrinomonadaceae bacterium]|nr:hypothetical protein [Pyrinomonadaceae bacterium]